MHQDTETSYRLSTPFKPKAYAISLAASPKRASFSGTVTVTGKVTEPTTTLALHARDLKVSAVSAEQKAQSTAGRAKLDTAAQVVNLTFAQPLKKGPVTLHMAFTGKLSHSMHGLYLAQDGPEKAIVSQCEASDARAIFPCIDEPEHKATFAWSVTTEATYTVLTNGKALTTTPVKGKKGMVTHSFAPTKVMSTYLTALTIGDFEPGKTVKVGSTPCRIFAGKGKAAQTQFAMEVTRAVLPWYATYFGKPYNYGKLDQVAVPGFDAGAMENVGAIFYRQNLLLMQEGQTSFGAQKRIAEVIAHEIAHQWFGNLVTMRWWDDLWLNEAFATWMAYTVCHSLYPKWHIWDDYLEGKESALIADALHSTHPIYNAVRNPAEATELFDVITYEKGCAVLRMCEHYLGHTTFRAGIRSYMAEFANGNAQGEDLWRALSTAAKKPVAALMHDWIHRPGHPVLRCNVKAHADAIVLTLNQSRFFAQPDAPESAPQKGAKKAPWMIPIVIAYDAGDGQKEHRVLMEHSKIEVTLPAAKGAKLIWAYANHDATGFYRTHMAPKMQRQLLAHGLPHLSAGARMALVHDQWALTRSGDASIEGLMPLLLQLGKDTNPGVFRSVASRLRALWAHVVTADDEAAFSALVRDVCRPHLSRLGFHPSTGEDAQTGALRATVIDMMGSIGKDEETLAQAAELADQEQVDPGCVDANLAGTLVSLSAVAGDKARLATMVKTYLKRKKAGLPPEVQTRYLYGMCAFEKKGPINQVLAMTLDGTIPQEQLRVILSALLGRRASGALAWTFIKKNWAQIGPRVGGMGIARLVESTGGLPFALKSDVAKFFSKNPVPEAQRAIKKAMEGFDLWEDLRIHHSGPLSQWLMRHRA